MCCYGNQITLFGHLILGGYTVGPQEVIDMLRQRSRPYLFSNTLPPPVVACASKVSEYYIRRLPITGV